MSFTANTKLNFCFFSTCYPSFTSAVDV